MELSVQRTRRTREFTGPTPHSVAILSKPALRKPKEYLILESRRKEERRNEAAEFFKYTEKFDLKTTWERETNKKIQRNAVKRKVESILQQQKYSLEERRDKLRNQLHHEEAQYMSELTSLQETPLERQAKMRERAKMLRDRREQERLALMEDKLEQRWRSQCEELRGLQFKRNQDQVCRERDNQLVLKQEEKQRKKEEEEMFAQMWKEDYNSKCKREEMEEAMQIERNREMLKVLTLQSAAIAKHQEEMQKLREHEAELLREQRALRDLEEENMLQNKKKQQEQFKKDLDISLKLKMKKQAKLAQEELAMDMKLLEEVLKQSSNEAQQLQQRKRELRDEWQHYREYLAEQQREEEMREKELDSMINAEVEKQWQVRLNQWKREREARRKLLREVVDTRKKQIQEKMTKVAEEKKRAEEEWKELEANIASHREMEKEQQKAALAKGRECREHLFQQMQFQEKMRQIEKAMERNELKEMQEAEKLHQLRVMNAIEHPDKTKLHPGRSMAANQHP